MVSSPTVRFVDPAVKFLFVHQNFPGQFLHLVRHLVAMREHEIVFITEANANAINGVRKVPYMKPRPASQDTHIAARELDVAARRAEIVARTANSLKQLGFTPDIIIGHQGWGEMLNLPDVYPGVPAIGYMEFYYQTDGADVVFDPEFPIDPADFPRIRAKNAINHIALNLSGHGVTPTRWQLSTYPDWAQRRIELMWEGVNLDLCSPDEKARHAPMKIGDMTIRRNDTLVTYVSRDLEPYRGVHTLIRALPALLRARKNLKVVMVGGDGVSYGAPPPDGGTWREVFLKEVADQIDPSRVVFPGRIEYSTDLAMLRRSDAHVYLTYPFVASWSLRESLAIGCAIVGGDTEPVREFITHGRNGLLTSFFDPQSLANAVLEVLEDKRLDQNLRTGARRYAERNLSMDDYLGSYTQKIELLTGGSLRSAEARARRAVPRNVKEHPLNV
jgi:glycosyltransferase involved in cell wall biosynthesis